MSICIHSEQNFEVSLLRGRVLGFDSGGNVVLACVEGEVWVTAPASDDVVLQADESVTVPGSGRIVVQALNAARFRVTEQGEARRNHTGSLA